MKNRKLEGLESWRAAELESYTAGELENWNAEELESWTVGELENWRAEQLESWTNVRRPIMEA